ncbi:hypothetical protein EJ05DRAFT_392664 [Pseudovirgaria hyperparasitica]|uniref:Uncharacterized protein n=1 Tax=Pseudovirgaria hyperparasitica TaxID=470096 RepID=A0A6A6W4P3_9PEZI|nr:uncharacterized protein EJ05DRAFT_392664 [Pseudovirgaria hyperparasitica]KAF2757525.1 hypothetical protein EJ05DRAFT_392664 [Pseudovirgaria hyperparasitica]
MYLYAGIDMQPALATSDCSTRSAPALRIIRPSPTMERKAMVGNIVRRLLAALLLLLLSLLLLLLLLLLQLQSSLLQLLP